MGSEIEVFKDDFENIDNNISSNNNILNDYIISLKSYIDNHQKDDIDFINESQSKYKQFNSLLKNNINKINNKLNEFDQLNKNSLQELEIRGRNYENHTKDFINKILSDLEKDETYINNNNNGDIKSFEEYKDTLSNINDENEHIKIDNYKNYHSVSEQLNDKLIKSNTIFKDNPLLNKTPEQNKYYNIYSWKITPDHDNIINNYRKLCKEKDHISMNTENKEENFIEEIKLMDNEEVNENETETISNGDKSIKNISSYDNQNTSDNVELKTIKDTEETKDLTVNNISIKKVLYLSHDNVNYDYKEMKFEELENQDNLFNSKANNNTINNQIYSMQDQKNSNLNQVLLTGAMSSMNNDIPRINDNSLSDNDNESINKSELTNQFESSIDKELSENNKNEFLLENSNEDEDEDTNSNSVGSVEIIVNENKEDDLSFDSDTSTDTDTNNNENFKENQLNIKNKQITKSIQKMDSAIELEEKLNKGKLKLNVYDNNESDNNNSNANVNVPDSLVTRKTFKNQKPLAGFNFTEKKKLISRSSSVPNTPTVVNKLPNISRNKDDLYLNNMQAKIHKPAIEPF